MLCNAERSAFVFIRYINPTVSQFSAFLPLRITFRLHKANQICSSGEKRCSEWIAGQLQYNGINMMQGQAQKSEIKLIHERRPSSRRRLFHYFKANITMEISRILSNTESLFHDCIFTLQPENPIQASPKVNFAKARTFLAHKLEMFHTHWPWFLARELPSSGENTG